MSEKDVLSLLAMLESIEKIEKITATIKSPEEFENDFRSFDACLLNFIVIGEAVANIDEEIVNEEQS